MSEIKLIPLVKAAKTFVQTPSRLEKPIIVSEEAFQENFAQGEYYPISSDTSGEGQRTVQLTHYDRRNGMKCSFLAKRE